MVVTYNVQKRSDPEVIDLMDSEDSAAENEVAQVEPEVIDLSMTEDEAETGGIESENEVELVKVINSNNDLVNFYSMSTDTNAAMAASMSEAVTLKPKKAENAEERANCEKVSEILKNGQEL